MRNQISRLVALFAALAMFAGAALAETVNVTFLLTNDIAKLSAKSRGGFARLAAVVKAERAKGGLDA